MEAPVRVSQVRPRLVSQREDSPATEPAPATVPTAAQRRALWAAQAVWLGLASGWLEAGVVLGHQALVGTVTNLSVRLNRYHVALGLLAHLAIFAGAWGLAAGLAGRWSRRWWRDPLVTGLGWFVAFASPLLALEELHAASSLILAAALATVAGRWWLRHREVWLRRTLGPLVVGSVVAGGWSAFWVQSSEDRALASLPPASPEAPNVVLLVLDTVRADHLSLYGYPRPTTPHLDAWKDRAARFAFARSAAPWTLPAHATMFTGRWPHELSVDYDRPLDATHPTLAAFLAGHGYQTGGFVGNTVYANSWFGIGRGFTRYEDAYENEEVSPRETLRSAALTRELLPLAVNLGLLTSDGRWSPRKTAAAVNRDALDWLDHRGSTDRPFFLFLNYIDAHGPYTVPDDFARQFSAATNPQLIQANRRAGNKSLPNAERYDQLDQLGIDAYDDAIRYIDAQIGHLLAELDGRGLRQKTWVIVTADHGEHFGEHGLYIHGNSLYRPLIDVPLLVIPPDGVNVHRVADPVSLRDLPATVADITGLGANSPFPGHSLRHYWDDAVDAPPNRDQPLSEWKIPHGTAGLATLPADDRTRTAIVHRDRIYHRDPLGPDALYHVDDHGEATDLTDEAREKPMLDDFQAVVEGFLELDRSR